MRTFSLLVLAILGFAFVACDDDDHLGDWAKAPEFSGRLRNQAVSFVIGDYAYVGTGFGVDLAEYTDFKKYNLNDGTWTDVPDNFPGKGRHGAVAFVAEKGGKLMLMLDWAIFLQIKYKDQMEQLKFVLKNI